MATHGVFGCEFFRMLAIDIGWLFKASPDVAEDAGRVIAEGRIGDADWARVHFLGNLAYPTFVALLQLSRVHVYLTYPFVLSWSLLEAMSVGCAIVASRTAPVLEAIEHDVTGRLVDFFDVDALAAEVCTLLQDAPARQRLGQAARERARSRYDLHTTCLPRQLQWVQQLAQGDARRP